MKKILLFATLFLALIIPAKAAEATFVMADIYGTQTINLDENLKWGDFDITVKKESGSNAPAFNKAGDVRLYAQNTITIKSSNFEITKIDFVLSKQGKDKLPAITANVGTIATQATGDTDVIWSGDTDAVTLTVGDKAIYTSSPTSAGQLCFSKVIITTSDGAIAVVAPEFSVESGTVKKGTEVVLTCATEGASIYYTTDESNPTDASTPYTEPIVINEDMTVKAIAYKGEDKSSVSTAKYTVEKTINTIAALKVLTNGTTFTYEGDLTVIGEYESGNHSYVYVTDGPDITLVYGQGKHFGYNSGDVLKAGWDGKVSYYAGLFELVPTTNPVVDGTAAVPTPVVINADNVAATYVPANINNYYEIKDLVIESETPSTNSNFNAKVGDQTIVVRNTFLLEAQQPGIYDVVGFIAAYDGGKTVATTNVEKLQFFPISYTKIVSNVEAPEFSISSSTVPAGTQVRITCKTEGASILYTTDGTDPNLASTLYNGPITINEDMTLKAIAVKGVDQSIVAVANYTVEKIYSTIADIIGLSNGTKVDYSGDLTVVYKSGQNIYVYDGEDYTLLYGNVACEAGDVLKGGWTAQVSIYGGMFEIKPSTTPTVDGTAAIPSPTEITVDNIATLYVPANVNGYYVMKNVTFDAATPSDKSNQTVTVGETSVVFRNNFIIGSVEAGTYDVVGFIGIYDYSAGTTAISTDPSKLQFFPIEYKTPSTDGINGIEVDENAPVQYYNLSGMPISNPAAGQVVIRVQSGKASKIHM